MIRSHVLICGGTGCSSSGSVKLSEKLAEELKAKGLDEEVKIVLTGCFGLCALGPIMIVYPEGTFYSRVTLDDIPEIVSEHLEKGRIVERLVYNDTAEKESGEAEPEIASLSETTFYKKQKRVALRNCGVINPENIDEYIAMDGYPGQIDRVVVAGGNGEVRRAGVVKRRQHDFDALVFTDDGAGHFKPAEYPGREPEFFDKIEIPILLRGVDERGGGRIGIFVNDVAGKREVEIFRHHQKMFSLLQLLRALLFERHQLIDGIESRLLNPGTPVQFGEGNDLFNLFVHPCRAGIAIGDGIGTELKVFIEKHEVDAPGIDTDRLDRTFSQSRVDTGLDRAYETIEIPAVVTVTILLNIIKPVDFFQNHFTVLK